METAHIHAAETNSNAYCTEMATELELGPAALKRNYRCAIKRQSTGSRTQKWVTLQENGKIPDS